jgi:hypothetical protein
MIKAEPDNKPGDRHEQQKNKCCRKYPTQEFGNSLKKQHVQVFYESANLV